MQALQQQDGFSLVDILVAVALIGVVAAMAVPTADSSARAFRLRGDAQSLANTVTLAKMRAASRFTRTRIRADLNAGSYRLEIWNKPAAGAPGAWVVDGGDIQLSRGVGFGFGVLDTPPPNTQAAIGQSPQCTAQNSLTANLVADTACIVFNSRGVPVDNGGNPTGGNALYITDGTNVYGTTITATPLVRQWWSNGAVASWVQR